MKVYFDNAATTPLHPEVYKKMIPYLDEFYGNPSSIHSFGRKTRVAIEAARETAAEFINADASEIYFVSGGTEASNFPIFGIAKKEFDESGKNKIITSKTEHHCVLDSFKKLEKSGFAAEYLNVDRCGRIDIQNTEERIDDKTSLVSIIHINNETGAVNNLEELSILKQSREFFLHTDAVQSFGKVDIDVQKINIDSLSASAHKIQGPKGIGLTYVKSGTPVSPILFGGSQERNRRGGTENVPAIIGFAEAIKIAARDMKDNLEKVALLKNKFEEGIDSLSTNIYVNCAGESSPYILSLTLNPDFYNIDAEALLMFLDINGIAASNGAACTSGTLKPSHVIMALGKSAEEASGTIRFSFGAQNRIEEVDYTLSVIDKLEKQFRRL